MPIPIPKSRHLEVRRAIASEVNAADKAIGSIHRLILTDGWDMDKMRESDLALGFLRGRTILQAISYGRNYWEVEYGLGIELGQRPETEHPGVTVGTRRLGQLATLSRVPINPVGEQWSLPSLADIIASKRQLREELGIASSTNTSDFSGLVYDSFIDAIIAGEVAIGNPQQPVAQCYRP